MNGKILVTGTQFSENQKRRLETEGYEVECINKQDPTEQELVSHLQDKVGYILRGIEKVTDKVIATASSLHAISFTGADWKALISGSELATNKGVAITNAPGGNSYAVSEFAVAVALAMQRNLFEIGTSASNVSGRTSTIKDSVVGVVGVGAIGQKIIARVKAFEPEQLLYYSRSQRECGAEYVSFDNLLTACDVIFIAAPSDAGQLFNKDAIQKIKTGALIVNISPMNLIDFDALYDRLQTGEIRAANDWPAPDERYKTLSPSTWFNSNSHTAYNTHQAAELCSEMAVTSLLNLLKTGEDQYLVNPEYRDKRKV